MRGIERADRLAKTALKKGNVEMQVSISKAEVKSVIWEKTQTNKNNEICQGRWDQEGKGRHLYQIQKSVKGSRIDSGHRREDIVLGHCGLYKT